MSKSVVVLGILMMLLASSLGAQEAQFDVKQFTLDNGMNFLVVERPTAPVFSGFIIVGVGSANERTGNIGSAHLLEHMMFKGSKLVGTTDWDAEQDLWAKEDSIWARIDMARRQTRYIALNNPEKLDVHLKFIESLETILDSLTEASSQYVIQNEFDRIYTRNGAAQFNATTGYDFTNYFVSLPSNRLELWFLMESDRLKHPAMREFFPERDVVAEERRQSVENSSDLKLFEQLIGTAFISHPYQIFWEWRSEETNLTRDDLMTFFNTYYIPQNMAVAVVGDVKLDDVRKFAEKYFGDIPRGKDFEPIYTEEIEQTGERRVDLHYESSPAVNISYHGTAFDSPDEPVFQVIQRLIGDGRTSRLYKSLVLDKQLCVDVSVDVFPGNEMGDLYPGVMNIYAYPRDEVTTIDVEAAIYEELHKLATVPVDSLELTKIKNNIDAAMIWSAYDNLGLASYLASTQALTKDWKYLYKLRDKLKAVTPEDIMRVASQYLADEKRTVATLIPLENGGDNE